MKEKKTKIVHVDKVSDNDYNTVQGFGIPITVFIRDCFKKRADDIRANEKKKK